MDHLSNFEKPITLVEPIISGNEEDFGNFCVLNLKTALSATKVVASIFSNIEKFSFFWERLTSYKSKVSR